MRHVPVWVEAILQERGMTFPEIRDWSFCSCCRRDLKRQKGRWNRTSPHRQRRGAFQGAESLMICSSLMNVSVPTVCSHAAPLSTHQTTRKANPCFASPKRPAPSENGFHYQVSKLNFVVIYCSVTGPERLKNTASVKPQKREPSGIWRAGLWWYELPAAVRTHCDHRVETESQVTPNRRLNKAQSSLRALNETLSQILRWQIKRIQKCSDSYFHTEVCDTIQTEQRDCQL